MAPIGSRGSKNQRRSGSKSSGKSTKRQRVEDPDSEGNEDDYEAIENENERLKAETMRLKTRLSLEAGGTKENRNDAEKAMARMVTKRTKQHLFKRCKFIKNDVKLIKATRYVIVWFSVL